MSVTSNPNLDPANPFFDIRHQIEERDLKQRAIFPHSGTNQRRREERVRNGGLVRTDVRSYGHFDRESEESTGQRHGQVIHAPTVQLDELVRRDGRIWGCWGLKDRRVIRSGCRSQTLDTTIGVSAEYDLLVGLIYSILG